MKSLYKAIEESYLNYWMGDYFTADEWMVLIDKFGKTNVSLLLNVYHYEFKPKHKWTNWSDPYKKTTARYFNSKSPAFKERAKWARTRCERSGAVNVEHMMSVWYISLQADMEGLDGVTALEKLTDNWGEDRIIRFVIENNSVTSLIKLHTAGVDGELSGIILC